MAHFGRIGGEVPYVATRKQRRQAAARKLQRQMERRHEQAVKRRRRTQIAGAAIAVAVVAAAAVLIALNTGGDDDNEPAAAPTSPATATTAPAGDAKSTSGPCKYAETEAALSDQTNYKDVGLPPDPKKTPATGTVPLTVQTNQGAMEFTLDRAKAPCAVQSFDFLAGKKFFDGTSCPRLTTDGIYVLQCGSPSSSQVGGPTYQYKEENTKKADYSEGVIAMAKSQQAGSTGSQFFIIYKDSNGGLGKDYSVIGKVTKGLDIVKDIGKAGTKDKGTDGAPKKGLTFMSISASA